MRGRNGGPDGVLLLDKPAGVTSTRALARAKRALASLKGGHTGTLDPFATGLLPLVFGEATKFSRFLIDARKSYEATLRLGEETVTGDTEAEISARRPVDDVDIARIDSVLESFVGHQDQVPPMHSAVRIDGRRLYDIAREGREIERPARRIEIGALERAAFDGRDLTVRVECSKGTYVRTLAQDVGAALGCGAHLVALRRTVVGGFRLAESVTLEALEGGGTEAARARLLATEALVAGLPRLDANEEESTRFMHGRVVARPARGEGADIAVFSPEGRFLGVGREAPGGIAPLRLMATASARVA